MKLLKIINMMVIKEHLVFNKETGGEISVNE